MAFSADGKRLATCGADKTFRLWDAADGRPLLHQPIGIDRRTALWVETITSGSEVALSPRGRFLAALAPSAGQTHVQAIQVWDVLSGLPVTTLRKEGFDPHALAFAPDDNTLAAAGDGGTQLWSVRNGKEMGFLPVSVAEKENGWKGDDAVASSPDGRFLATGDAAGVIRLWDWTTGEMLRAVDTEQGTVVRLALSADGRILVSCHRGRFGVEDGIHLWETASGRLIRSLDAHLGGVSSLACSADGRLVATAGERQSLIRLWSTFTGEELALLPGHPAVTSSLTFSPDGKRLASGSADTTALVWDLDGLGVEPPRFNPDMKELELLWDDLAAPDARRSYPALWAMAGAGDSAVRLLAERVRPAAALDLKRLGTVLDRLDADEYPRREEASRELLRFGKAARPQMRQRLAAKPSAEARRRLEAALDATDGPTPPEELRILRAIQALEYAATPRARELLSRLAAGDASSGRTREAQAALRRLGRQPSRVKRP